MTTIISRTLTSATALQSAEEFLRTVGAFAIATALESLAAWIGLLQLDPTASLILLAALTAILRAIGAWIRGPVEPAETLVAEPGYGRDSVPIVVPARRYRRSFFLPF